MLANFLVWCIQEGGWLSAPNMFSSFFSSIDDLVTHWLTDWGLSKMSNPRDLWPLRHLLRVMRKHDLTNISTTLKFSDYFEICWQFWQLLTSFTLYVMKCKMSWNVNVMKYQMSWSVKCHEMSNVKYHEMSNVKKCQMSWNVKCNEMSNVMKCQM